MAVKPNDPLEKVASNAKALIKNSQQETYDSRVRFSLYDMNPDAFVFDKGPNGEVADNVSIVVIPESC